MKHFFSINSTIRYPSHCIDIVSAKLRSSGRGSLHHGHFRRRVHHSTPCLPTNFARHWHRGIHSTAISIAMHSFNAVSKKQAFSLKYTSTKLNLSEFADPNDTNVIQCPHSSTQTPPKQGDTPMRNQPMFQSCSQWALLNTANMASVSDSS